MVGPDPPEAVEYFGHDNRTETNPCNEAGANESLGAISPQKVGPDFELDYC